MKPCRVSRILELRQCGIAIERYSCDSNADGQALVTAMLSRRSLRQGERVMIETLHEGAWVMSQELRNPEPLTLD